MNPIRLASSYFARWCSGLQFHRAAGSEPAYSELSTRISDGHSRRVDGPAPTLMQAAGARVPTSTPTTNNCRREDRRRIAKPCRPRATAPAGPNRAGARRQRRCSSPPGGRLSCGWPRGAMSNPRRFATNNWQGHALAGWPSYVRRCARCGKWAVRLAEGGQVRQIEALWILEVAYGEYLAQLAAGLPLAEGGIRAAPPGIGLDDGEIAIAHGAAGTLSAGVSSLGLQSAPGSPKLETADAGISASRIRPWRWSASR